MDPEGMVHALEEIHRLLKPDGAMIDIHPLPELPYVEAYLKGKAIFSEPLLISYLEDLNQAESALAHAVDIGLFAGGKGTVIDFHHRTASPTQLLSHWDAIEPYSDSPKDPAVAVSEAKVFSRLESCFQASGHLADVAIRERAFVSCFFPHKD